jgi:uncharacterized protein
MVASPVDVVMRLYSAHETRAEDDRASVLSPDLVWFQAESHPYAGEGPYSRDEVLTNVVARLNVEWDRFDVEVEEVLAAGERVVVTARYKGTYLATGRSIDAQAVCIYTVRDDAIVRFQQYMDTAQIRKAMGVDE